MLKISEILTVSILKLIYLIVSLFIGLFKIIYKLVIILTKKSLNALYYIGIVIAIVFILIKYIL